jgi:hypothetical protein
MHKRKPTAFIFVLHIHFNTAPEIMHGSFQRDLLSEQLNYEHSPYRLRATTENDNTCPSMKGIHGHLAEKIWDATVVDLGVWGNSNLLNVQSMHNLTAQGDLDAGWRTF